MNENETVSADECTDPLLTDAATTVAQERHVSFLRRMLGDVFIRWGGRLGLGWILLLTLLAVFSPFIANSHPLMIRTDGKWSSPLLTHLAAIDVILLFAFLYAFILICLPRVALRKKTLIFTVLLVATSIGALILIRPPETVVYEKYREMMVDGQIESVVNVPVAYSPSDRLRDQPGLRLTGPSGEHLMGTTSNGADLLSNMVYATRIALSIGFISTGIAILIGILVGGLMGYFSGVVDLLGMRLVEIFSAIPTLFLLLAFVAVFEPNLYIMMAIIGLTSWVGYAMFIRAEFLKLRQQDFVQAARACGLPLWSILFRHMLPNGVAPVLVSASFGVAGAILAESTLSFLGIGLVEEASWGKLLNQALGVGGTFYWWIALYPGLAIFLTVFAYNLVGEALRDAIDPHAQQSP